ncbi:hypothetical protein Dda3937_04453 [Dickeya dadantii 3937]|uniref:Uncharacterized protein n=1 Tax=Dickeya dadantii (strain 3937) TaxID=198628 RepID=E0SIB7_DICD3|nr:hypothetical protein Dda3937_04453 [Dickeya dadantii 3937]
MTENAVSGRKGVNSVHAGKAVFCADSPTFPPLYRVMHFPHRITAGKQQIIDIQQVNYSPPLRVYRHPGSGGSRRIP